VLIFLLTWTLYYLNQQKFVDHFVNKCQSTKNCENGQYNIRINKNLVIFCWFGHLFLVVNFGSPKVHLSSSQCLESFNSNHWRLLPPHYFLLSYSLLLDMCHNHISPNFENDINTYSKLNFHLKVGNRKNYRLGTGHGWQSVLLPYSFFPYPSPPSIWFNRGHLAYMISWLLVEPEGRGHLIFNKKDGG